MAEGLDKELSNIDDVTLSSLFEHTAKACFSQTSVKDKFVDIYEQTGTADGFNENIFTGYGSKRKTSV